MVYRAIGLMGDDLENGVELTFVEFQEQAGQWDYEILQNETIAYTDGWRKQLKNAGNLPLAGYHLLHTDYGHYIAGLLNQFIDRNNLHYKTSMIAFPGYTLLNQGKSMQLGDVAAVAAITQLPVIGDFYSIDAALGGSPPVTSKILAQKLSLKEKDAGISITVLFAFMAVLRWRQEYNVFASESGASKNSIGGGLWTGQEA